MLTAGEVAAAGVALAGAREETAAAALPGVAGGWSSEVVCCPVAAPADELVDLAASFVERVLKLYWSLAGSASRLLRADTEVFAALFMDPVGLEAMGGVLDSVVAAGMLVGLVPCAVVLVEASCSACSSTQGAGIKL